MAEKLDKRIGIKESTLNAILQYMGKRPYAEVYQLVEKLHIDFRDLNQKKSIKSKKSSKKEE